MIRLHVVVEGQTEETFVRDLLAPGLGASDIFADAHQVTTRRHRAHIDRGGFSSYAHIRRDLDLWMKQDRRAEAWFTTMVDLHRLPQDFPGLATAAHIQDPIARTERLEREFENDVSHRRFLPYIQVHEFEALLFTDPSSFAIAFPAAHGQIAVLNRIREAFTTPEHIDDGPETAPSRRIMSLFPRYSKPVDGPLIAKAIGLAAMRRECRHFNAWIEALESASTRCN